ncbi:MAG TPA: hypothetical protein VKE98_01455 [Gemmataceae bacterium]|nr:hypothetical protein [Gemmataceae bacterium]
MPTSVHYIGAGRGLHFKCWGVLTGEDVMSATASLESDPDAFRNLTYSLVDLIEVTELELTGDEVRSVAYLDRRLAQINACLCVAVVAPKGVVFGMARMWEVLAEPTGWRIRIFRDLHEAEIWIEEMLAVERK